MKLIIAFITHNRLNYSKRTFEYLTSTIQVPHYIVAVDNKSTDGTKAWLKSLRAHGKIDMFIDGQDNYYPGKATNMGWAMALRKYPEATHLMRLDNDMELRKGWDKEAEDFFKKIPELGQLGLDHEAIEHPKAELRIMRINGKELNPWPGCVGGPNIIRRAIWDEGIRYMELRWDDGRHSPVQEDSQFSRAIQSHGYLTGHTQEEFGRTFANETNWKDYPDYYKKTMTDRGYVENVEKI